MEAISVFWHGTQEIQGLGLPIINKEQTIYSVDFFLRHDTYVYLEGQSLQMKTWTIAIGCGFRDTILSLIFVKYGYLGTKWCIRCLWEEISWEISEYRWIRIQWIQFIAKKNITQCNRLCVMDHTQKEN